MGVCLGDNVALDLHVHHDEVSTIERVGHDATHEGCGEYHCIWAFLIEELFDGYLICKVEFFVRTTNQIRVAPLKEVIPNSGTHKSVVSRYINL